MIDNNLKHSNKDDNVTDTNSLLLNRLFDTECSNEMIEKCEIYVSITELIVNRFPDMPKRLVIDWALAYAMSKGDWYGESLSTRMQNSMVVSALLLTVTASFFVSPPDLSDSYKRVFSYFCGISSLLFMISIIFGILFIENAMSRAFGKSDRFVLIMKQYSYVTISQACSYIGALMFPIILMIPIRYNYNLDDSVVLIMSISIGFIILILANIVTNKQVNEFIFIIYFKNIMLIIFKNRLVMLKHIELIVLKK